MRLIIFGPPASGKGTQAELLAKELNIKHISTGELLRAEVASGSDTGKKIQNILTSGDLVPPEIANELTRKAASETTHFILDGYPRSTDQADFLDSITTIDTAIVLDVPEDVSIKRITGRRVCPEGHDYHVEFKPSKEKGVCDIDNKPLSRRSDDTEETIKNRLQIYKETTLPAASRYLVIRVNGDQTIDGVHKDIVTALRPSQQ